MSCTTDYYIFTSNDVEAAIDGLTNGLASARQRLLRSPSLKTHLLLRLSRDPADIVTFIVFNDKFVMRFVLVIELYKITVRILSLKL